MYSIVKRPITLIEIMIVMFLIALILGVVAYNYQGTLEEGKAFKTKTAQEKLQTVLSLYISENPEEADGIDRGWKEMIKNSPLVQNPTALIKDGWGNEFEVRYNAENDRIIVYSRKMEEYRRKNPGTLFKSESKEE